MSGSGGGGGGGGPDTPVVSCEELVIDTQLSSPKDDVVDKIKVGDILEVATQTKAGMTFVVVLYKSKVAGGLASPQLARLRECLNKGVTYQAKVMSKRGGQVRVLVEAT
jgi:hypothetical protein